MKPTQENPAFLEAYDSLQQLVRTWRAIQAETINVLTAEGQTPVERAFKTTLLLSWRRPAMDGILRAARMLYLIAQTGEMQGKLKAAIDLVERESLNDDYQTRRAEFRN